jgi:DNA-binding MarR family transcriptional regulator
VSAALAVAIEKHAEAVSALAEALREREAGLERRAADRQAAKTEASELEPAGREPKPEPEPLTEARVLALLSETQHATLSDLSKALKHPRLLVRAILDQAIAEGTVRTKPIKYGGRGTTIGYLLKPRGRDS